MALENISILGDQIISCTYLLHSRGIFLRSGLGVDGSWRLLRLCVYGESLQDCFIILADYSRVISKFSHQIQSNI